MWKSINGFSEECHKTWDFDETAFDAAPPICVPALCGKRAFGADHCQQSNTSPYPCPAHVHGHAM